MSTVAAQSPAPSRPDSTVSADADRPPVMAIHWVLLICLALSALTLLFPSTPTYDPWAWLLWGREITHLDLVTDGGPSWKPLPVMFNVPFSFFGADVAPYLWLWIARAGALLALAMSFRLARRLVGRGAAGVVAGVFAAAFLLTTYQYVRDAALGNSEALLAGLFLWAFERHLDGRRDHALYLGLAVCAAAARRRGRSWASTACGCSCASPRCGSRSPWSAWPSRCCGSARSCGARASPSGRPAAPASPTPAAPRSPTTRGSRWPRGSPSGR